VMCSHCFSIFAHYYDHDGVFGLRQAWCLFLLSFEIFLEKARAISIVSHEEQICSHPQNVSSDEKKRDITTVSMLLCQRQYRISQISTPTIHLPKLRPSLHANTPLYRTDSLSKSREDARSFSASNTLPLSKNTPPRTPIRKH
jgi:hypothetical protein